MLGLRLDLFTVAILLSTHFYSAHAAEDSDLVSAIPELPDCSEICVEMYLQSLYSSDRTCLFSCQCKKFVGIQAVTFDCASRTCDAASRNQTFDAIEKRCASAGASIILNRQSVSGRPSTTGAATTASYNPIVTSISTTHYRTTSSLSTALSMASSESTSSSFTTNSYLASDSSASSSLSASSTAISYHFSSSRQTSFQPAYTPGTSPQVPKNQTITSASASATNPGKPGPSNIFLNSGYRIRGEVGVGISYLVVLLFL